MRKNINLIVVFVSTILFTFLFYHKALGINVLIYEFGVLGWLFFSKQLDLKRWNQSLTLGAVVLSAAQTVLHHSDLSYVINFLVFFIFIGVVASPGIRSLINSFKTAFTNIFMSVNKLVENVIESKINNQRTRFVLKRIRIFLVPLVIITLFLSLYSWSNPAFGEIVNNILTSIGDTIADLFEHVEFAIILTILFGALISTFIFMRTKNVKLEEMDQRSSDDLKRLRKKNKGAFKMIALKNELRAALFLFGALNLILLALNVMDVNHVWFNFEWEGQYLKQFVHEGTYLLIVAILLSIVLVLYFFRSNLNFYSKNKWLKAMCYAWIGQNIFLTVSVGLRNWHYIEHYALAYKRIAIVFFLLLTVYGLISVVLKVKDRRSSYYLIRTNAYAWMIVLVFSSFFNWDRIIAKYNFEQANKSFVHLNFLSNLSDTALPYLDRELEDLEGMDSYQMNSFKLGSFSSYRKLYMTPELYQLKIEERKQKFKQKWENKGLLEWNYAEYKAYNELFGQSKNRKSYLSLK